MKCPEITELPPPPPGKKGWPWTTEDLDVAHPGFLAGDNLGRLDRNTNTHWPKVSIVTPSFNQSQYLECTIRSVLLQGYPSLEYVIMDGGSSDGSIEIIRKYESWLDGWTSVRDNGQSEAINNGFKRCTGDVFGWVNSDDYLMQGALFNLMALRHKFPDCLAWVGACREVDGDDRHIKVLKPMFGAAQEAGDWGRSTHICQPSCLFSAKDFIEVGSLNEHLHYVMDVELWMKLLRRGTFAASDYICSVSRVYMETKTKRNLLAKTAEFVTINVYAGANGVAEEYLRRYMVHVKGTQTADDIEAQFDVVSILDAMSTKKAMASLGRYGKMKLCRSLERLLGH